jgi:hypothetical protein
VILEKAVEVIKIQGAVDRRTGGIESYTISADTRKAEFHISAIAAFDNPKNSVISKTYLHLFR